MCMCVRMHMGLCAGMCMHMFKRGLSKCAGMCMHMFKRWLSKGV